MLDMIWPIRIPMKALSNTGSPKDDIGGGYEVLKRL